MGTEIIIAIIGIVGVLIGLGVSFLLQALQRRWSREDQKRDWERRNLEEYSETFKGIAEHYTRIAMRNDAEAAFAKVGHILLDIQINPPPITDSKLNELLEQIDSEYSKTEDEDKKWLEILYLVTQAQKRINELIEKTYK